MYSIRRWVVRNARFFEATYQAFEPVVIKLAPLWNKVGYQRVEKPVSKLEKLSKELLFDCKMCGQCALSATGMSCPMNCPKSMRNGPCGGVLQNGNCEVLPDKRCVWVEAWEGSKKMQGGGEIHVVQLPLDHRLQGSSSWLRVARQATDEASQHKQERHDD
ncbi:methylenetetrahydrofolate reductase C-terminal domain-containing protein [Vreelandella zhaodongensis]|uniref:Methylenetetrahydrofolate reductase C-terminal domain-containing protein n=1 Tax=Vreelandella zhaodongensis TaxID=1176240 RepID=A0ABX2SW87_VREZH|nr:methylenetetrahydrofolate reductase C-terminal domain-containing protein [Halomonas zhaodongensis]NYS46222.1 methylenetetrahydrofolate reductase C-terminal domain-containing protein [Halomonas zhaodongensis]